MADIKTFSNPEFGNVKFITDENESWMLATDVCTLFGCSNPSKAIKDADLDESQCKVLKYKALNQTEKAYLWQGNDYSDKIVINESGLYALLFALRPTKARGISEEAINSRIEQLSKFKKWVTSEVLPSIRKHGAYMTNEAIQRTLTDPDYLIQLATILKQEQEKNAALEREKALLVSENKEKEEVIELQKPKVTFANAIIGSRSSILIGELAKLISQNGIKVGQNRLFEWMRNNGYLGKENSFRNIPNQKYIEQKLFEIKKGTRSGNDGVLIETTTTKVTGKGQEYFVNGFLSGRFTL